MLSNEMFFSQKKETTKFLVEEEMRVGRNQGTNIKLKMIYM